MFRLYICFCFIFSGNAFKLTTIPDKRVGTRRKLSPTPAFNVDNQVIFSLFAGKKHDILQRRLGVMGDT